MKTKAKKFAQDVRTTWFQDLGCDDNVLIFYSLYDDELYISLGETVERVISDIELVRLNRIGDQALVGKIVSTPSPQAGAVQFNDSFTIVPTTTIIDMAQRKTTTGEGMNTLVDVVHVAIVNGPSVSSKLVYGAAVPVLLVLIILIMCLLANWCCRPAYGYHQPAQRTNKKTEKEEEEELEEEEEEEKEKV
ncbi:uncharacterized protein LOC121423255 [Lytechinus variegatus]|uniref:uncharacterized protein LOC121423255 n=1 Tax=Lytechinus variegatus TaxID=7654 RepID=UPI001BB21C0F|nr:uncharacterized protein LOC121423255 [Lytechinus variegatus]